MHPFVGGRAGVGSVLLACGDYKKLVFFKKPTCFDLVLKCCSGTNEGMRVHLLF